MEPLVDSVSVIGYNNQNDVISSSVFESKQSIGCLSDLECLGDGSKCIKDEDSLLSSSGVVVGKCQCNPSLLGEFCEISKTQEVQNGTLFHVLASFDPGFNLGSSGLLPISVDSRLSGLHIILVKQANVCPPRGSCVHGLCVCYPGKVGSQCIDSDTMCGLVVESRYTVFEQSSYAWNKYPTEMTGMAVIGSFLGLLFIAPPYHTWELFTAKWIEVEILYPPRLFS